MQAGRLRHRITLLKPVTARDEIGQPVTVFEPMAEVFASVMPLKSQESGGQIQRASTGFSIRLRYRDDIDHASKIKWERWELDIIGQPRDVDGRKRELEILAEWRQKSTA